MGDIEAAGRRINALARRVGTVLGNDVERAVEVNYTPTRKKTEAGANRLPQEFP